MKPYVYPPEVCLAVQFLLFLWVATYLSGVIREDGIIKGPARLLFGILFSTMAFGGPIVLFVIIWLSVCSAFGIK